MINLDFRRAADDDVDALESLVIAAYQRYTPRIGRPAPPMTWDYAKAVRDDEVWVAVQDEVIAGMIVLVREPDHLLVKNIAVLPAGQGHGIGTGLLALAEKQAERYGLPELRLFTHEAMTENLAYYPRRGYVETHRVEENGFSRVFFSKRLG